MGSQRTTRGNSSVTRFPNLLPQVSLPLSRPSSHLLSIPSIGRVSWRVKVVKGTERVTTSNQLDPSPETFTLIERLIKYTLQKRQLGVLSFPSFILTRLSYSTLCQEFFESRLEYPSRTGPHRKVPRGLNPTSLKYPESTS